MFISSLGRLGSIHSAVTTTLAVTLAYIMGKWLLMLWSLSLLSAPTVLGHELVVVVMVSSADVFDTSQVIPAVDLAFEDVKDWSLPFNLTYNTALDSQVRVSCAGMCVPRPVEFVLNCSAAMSAVFS